ncbi:MAG: DMT family transporter [Sphaerochaetaceae bacterium]
MQGNFYYLLDFTAGLIISIMVVCNTQLGVALSMGVSTIINQIVGIIILTLILVLFRSNRKINPKREHAPLYLWFNGLLGIPILYLNYLTVTSIGTSLAMSATVFGQSAIGLVFDHVGFMGLKKRTFSQGKLLSLGISLAGIIVMAFEGGSFSIRYIILGMLAGVLTMAQMVLNSTFSQKKGAVFSARQNVISGLFGALAFFLLFFKQDTIAGLGQIPSVSLALLISGGALACFVVVSTNMAIVMVPAVYSALLLSSGQVLMSLFLDGLLYRRFSLFLLSGALLMLLGMFLNFLSEKKNT